MLSAPTQPAPARALWPPDDTEESIVGTNRHQLTIMNVRLGINEAARTVTVPDQPAPWQALSQIMITGFSRPDGTRYTVMPDVLAYRRPIALDRGSLSLALDGPPLLVIEMASESTYEWDFDLNAGKGWSYAHGGVREYMVLDPLGSYLPERIRGWRLTDGIYQPWLPEANGLWQSQEIGVAIGVEDEWASVYSSVGRRQLREGEIGETLDRIAQERDRATQERDHATEELARKDVELADLRRRLADLEGPSTG